MKKMVFSLVLAFVPSLLLAGEQVSATSWSNKVNTPFFVLASKADDENVALAKSNIEKYLSENSYRYKMEKDGSVFILEIIKIPSKSRIEMRVYDPSTGEGIVPSNEDDRGKDTIKKFAEVMKSWDKNGALFKVVFQGMSFEQIQKIDEKISAEKADKNYGGQWQMVTNDTVLLAYRGMAGALISALTKFADPLRLELVKVEGRQIVFKLPAPAVTTTTEPVAATQAATVPQPAVQVPSAAQSQVTQPVPAEKAVTAPAAPAAEPVKTAK
jgi:hypothetical protein